MENVYNPHDLKCSEYVTDVPTFNIPNSKKIYTKETKADGNTLYTIKYKTFVITPNFTKILLNPNHEILAYIDIQRIPRQFESQFKDWKWFGIQEFHPELIGDFTHVITDKEDESRFLFRNFWKHKSDEHLYILDTSYLSDCEDWYRVGTDPLNDGYIETNFGVLDGSTRSYKYNTHPVVPADKIKNLKNAILIKEGIIKPKLTLAQKVKAFVQRRK